MTIFTRYLAPPLAAVCVIVAGCGGSDGSDDSNENTSPPPLLGGVQGSSIAGDIGQGYQSSSQRILPQYCILPPEGQKWTEVGASSGSMSMNLQSDRAQLARSIGVDISASYSFVSAAASFLRSIETDDLSSSYVFGGILTLKQRQVGGNYQVNPMLTNLTPVQWREACGDSFVQSTSRGASLNAALKFNFKSKTAKENFEASMKASYGLASLSTALKTAQSLTTSGVTVDVSALQVGGDVTQISRIINGTGAASCALADVEACLGYIDSIQKYASDDFPKQFLDSQGRPLTGEDLDRTIATVDYTIQPWSALVIPGQPNLRDQPYAWRLLGNYSAQYAARAKIDDILAMPSLTNRGETMMKKQEAALQDADLTISNNLQALGEAWSLCYPTVGPNCAAAVNNISSQLKTIPAETLIPWFDMVAADGAAPAHELDLVDINNDGRKELCYARSRTSPGVTVIGNVVQNGIACLSPVGEGYEEKPRIFMDMPASQGYGAGMLWYVSSENNIYHCSNDGILASIICTAYTDKLIDYTKTFHTRQHPNNQSPVVVMRYSENPPYELAPMDTRDYPHFIGMPTLKSFYDYYFTTIDNRMPGQLMNYKNRISQFVK